MGTYVWRSCPKCGYKIESGVIHYVALGSPIMNCPKCDNLLKLDHINEWELLSLGGKIYHFVASLKTALFLSVLAGFLIALIMKLIHKEIDLITLYTISPIIAFIFTIIMNIKNISDSKKRMSDSNYRKSLENFGFIKNKSN